MWNSKKPLDLLMSMPETLDKDNLIKLQRVIDVDKLKNSRELGHDLCGSYAPFCENCNKHVPYPCAQAYVNMKKTEGFNVKVEQSLTAEAEPVIVQDEHIDEPMPEINGEPAAIYEATAKSETYIAERETEIAVASAPEVEERADEPEVEPITGNCAVEPEAAPEPVQQPETAEVATEEEVEKPKRIRIAYLRKK